MKYRSCVYTYLSCKPLGGMVYPIAREGWSVGEMDIGVLGSDKAMGKGYQPLFTLLIHSFIPLLLHYSISTAKRS